MTTAPFNVSDRKIIIQGSDVVVKETKLAPGEAIPWHHHSNVADIFYCIEGELWIECKDAFSGERSTTLKLKVGESAEVNVGTAHRPYNPGDSVTRFILIQGVGEYDWLAYF